jgi:hypothetical protein
MRTDDAQAIARQLFGAARSHHERDVASSAHKARAEISAQRAGSDDQNTHIARNPDKSRTLPSFAIMDARYRVH